MKFNIVIPARWGSQRLPGKPLLDLYGKSILQRVYLQAQLSDADKIVIATDDKRILDAAVSFGAQAYMTDKTHQSGTDRICEVANILNWSDDTVIVNVQADEPLIEPELINQVAYAVEHSDAQVASLYSQLDPEHAHDSHSVKVVHDKQGFALYFSRHNIPFVRDDNIQQLLQHIGIYAYTAKFLRKFVTWEQADIEKLESLEQLRILYNGYKIYLEQACVAHATGIDTQADFEKIENILQLQEGLSN